MRVKEIMGKSWFDEDRCIHFVLEGMAESKGLFGSVRKAVSFAMIAFHEIKHLVKAILTW